MRRCAIYTRKSTEEGLDQAFNSLDAQREACEAYVVSQRAEGWIGLPARYDDGGYSGGNLARPGLKRLIADIESDLIDTVVVYKVDRLTRSLSDFAKLVDLFDKQKISFVSVTQQFNTTSSMGRLTLNVLLSFAQFEREVTGERIRDKIAASKKKGLWMGGHPPLGYDLLDRRLIVNQGDAATVRLIFSKYQQLQSVHVLRAWLRDQGHVSKPRISNSGRHFGGAPFSRGALYAMLRNPVYLGKISHKGILHDGQHEPIISTNEWQAVQEILRDRLAGSRSSHHRKSASLLAGVLFDSSGARLTPSHTNRRGRRYRYYLSTSATRGESNGAEAIRMPAHVIEGLVIRILVRTFEPGTDRARLTARLESVTSKGADVSEYLDSVAAELQSESYARQFLIVRQVARRIAITSTKVEIEISTQQLCDALMSRARSDDPTLHRPADLGRFTFRISEKFDFKRPGAVLSQNSGRPAIKSRKLLNAALIKAIARTHVWREALLTGSARSALDLARMSGVSTRYVREIMSLMYLSPRIVERILNGTQPSTLTLDRLVRCTDFSWEAQEAQALRSAHIAKFEMASGRVAPEQTGKLPPIADLSVPAAANGSE